jgi:CMP-N-acetylneuraminic acid synthetase
MIKVGQNSVSVGAFIFARGGSKGIKRKNLQLLEGKPLIQYSIDSAFSNAYIDEIYVSTDDEEIATTAERLNATVPFIRPASLSHDDSPELLAWQHALTFLRNENKMPDIFISLPCTSPLRSNIDVSQSIESLINSDADICISICKSERNPYFNMVEIDEFGIAELLNKNLDNITRRQDAPQIFDITTVAYSAWSKYLLETDSIMEGKVTTSVVPRERAIDIDTKFDFDLARFLLQKNQ